LTGLERSGRMCEFCGDDRCTLTKQQVLEHGPILENNACGIMRLETEETPQTYCFEGIPAYYSFSALIPNGDEESSPHDYARYVFDEDSGLGGVWEEYEINNPLMYQTEQEFLKKNEAGRAK
jgi:hypothetical protein